MASQPKKQRLLTTLSRLAEDELRPDASGLDWVELQVARGATMREIRDRVVEKWPEVHDSPATMSHDWMRWIIVRSYPGAKKRLATARAAAGVARFDTATGLETKQDRCSIEPLLR